jgi:hypothetical protein
LSFLKPFQTQNFEIELFSNFSRFLKHFKASHQQTKTSCDQNNTQTYLFCLICKNNQLVLFPILNFL